MSLPIFLKPVFREKIWGGSSLRDKLGYDAPHGKIGECFAISGLADADCEILSGRFSGKTLGWMYKNHSEIFGECNSDEFPLLSKVIDAVDDLSIQVHPDDAYANANENGSLGKTESWYILDCKPDATIIVGQKCANVGEFACKVVSNAWKEILVEKPIHPGDFIQINPGTVHSINAGTILVENQQSSDITYRVYDYDRLENGKHRPLHLRKSMDVINFGMPEPEIKNYKNAPEGITTLEENDKYSIWLLNVGSSFGLPKQDTFAMCNVLQGQGTIQIADNSTEISANQNFILPANLKTVKFTGNLEILLTSPSA